MHKATITADPLWRLEGQHTRLLREAGFETVMLQRVPLNEDDTIEALEGMSAVIAGSEPYTERVFSRLPDLRIISRSGVGYDRVDVAAAERAGVTVSITPNGNFEAVAEHVFALLLGLTRSIVRNDRETRGGHWPKTPLVPIRKKTIGIIGLGRIGRRVARHSLAFGMKVLGTDPIASQDGLREQGIEVTTFEDLLARADFVTLHLPMMPATQGIIDRSALARMKPGAFLINTARGGLVVEADLVEALRTGRLAGAGLDVLADEPPLADNPLLALDNVVISPHVAATDSQAIEDMGNEAAQNIIDFFEGRLSPIALITRKGS
jgi:D-3-phosphoglycerate dehydrogenase